MKNIIDISLLNNWDDKKCLTYLSQNYGLRGIHGTGITRDSDKRTLKYLRAECFNQIKFNIENGII